jgi:hypothetical protein
MEIKELNNKLRTKFKRIWRCADSNKWYILKNADLLTFDWIDRNRDYTKLSAKDIGSGKKALYPFVNSLKIGDLVFVMGKNSFQGIAICESEYEFNGLTLNMGDTGDKPAVKVEYIFRSESSVNHNLQTHNNPTTFAEINQYNFGLENVLAFLKNSLPDAYNSLVNSLKTNYKQRYTTWLNSTNKEGSKKAGSYIRAIDILSEITNMEIFEEDNISTLNTLYEDLLIEQEKTDGRYYYEQAPSYGVSRFYSAAIKSYSEFIKQLSQPQIEVKNTQTNMALNQILFGPPGTGKTYNSIDKSVAIATGFSSDHFSNKKQFDDLRKQGQIEFVTFHQNYSYEDFMIGIRPNVSETTSDLSFKKHYGIFYEIAKRARENYENSLKDELTISRENWVKEKFEEFKEYVEIEVEENGKFTIKNNVSIYSVEDEVFIYTGEKENGELWKNQRIGMHYDALINIYLADVKNRQDIKKLENVPSLEKQHATYSFKLIEKFREFLIEKGYRYQSSTVQKEPLKNFVLIIDEINRANISKVFGELITLLEDDKRLGAENELKITLPNGEKEFGVPPNLFLIGTMNTADKSIALIDIALRRRFEFLGFYPKYDTLRPEASLLLKKINAEIFKEKKSSDYLIGHAYFIKDQPIETTLKNKIIPLLMEYFSGKTDILLKIFSETCWEVSYDNTTFNWKILQR